MPQHIAIFASGTGSNAQAIINHFNDRDDVKVVLVASNKEDAPVLEKAKSAGIDTLYMSPELRNQPMELARLLQAIPIDLIVLAGYLKKIPIALIRAFPNKIINIHPALLPKYGGKGMYGINVHRAVKEAGEKQSGITIHFVNEDYDKGEVIFQQAVDLEDSDSPEDIAAKVLKLEHYHFPRVIDELLTGVRKES
jgi:phosphoribosylglycinamide formyltransferase-1